MLETPLARFILDDQRDGVLRGRDEIQHFLNEGAKRRPDLVRWFRTGRWFSHGDTVIWEYPRETPDGDQIELVEVMDINEAGLIQHHRIYWGWFGMQHLMRSQKSRPLESA